MLNEILKLGRQRLWLAHREYLRGKHELKYLFWECTLNCNFRCKHCGSRAGEENVIETVSTEDIKNAFSDIAKSFDAKKIAVGVTGGEPLLRKDLFEVMEYASSLGFGWGMISNGYLANDETVKKAQKAGMKTLDISIDGIGEIHDRFRNMPGSYEKAINTVKLFRDANFLETIRITSTINRNNIDFLEQMHDVFFGLKIPEWRLVNIDPIGRSDRRNDLLLDKDQMSRLLGFIKGKRKQGLKMHVSSSCAHYLGDDLEDEVRSNFFYCATGINVGSILHNGDIFVCPNVPREKKLIQGNIKQDSFSRIWNSEYTIFRDENRTKCESCSKCRSWNECLGGSFHTWDFKKNEQKFCLLRDDLYL